MDELRQSGNTVFRRCFDSLIHIYICFYTLFMVLLTLGFVPDRLLSMINLASLIVGTALIIAYFVMDRPFIPGQTQFPLFVLLFALFLCFALTILVNGRRNMVGNGKALLANAVQLLLFFFYLAGAPRERAASLFRVAMGSVIALTFAVAAANTVIVLGGITVRHDIYQYAGLFSNPNNSSICAVSFLCSLYFLRYGRTAARWWLMPLNMVLQLIVVILCRSRACLIMLAVGVGLFAVSFIFELRSVKLSRRVLMVLGLAAAAAAVLLFSQGLLKPIKTGSKSAGTPDVLDMQQVKKSSNEKRMNFIISGTQVFLRHPVFGVGPRNVADTVKEAFPQVNLQGIEKGGLHNAYLQLLVSNGLAGVLALLALVIYCAMRIFKAKVYEKYYVFAIFAALMVYAAFEINVLFVNFVNSMLFWSLLGYALNLAKNDGTAVCAVRADESVKTA